MSMAQSPASRGKSRERSQTDQVLFSPEFSQMKSSPRFGTLSHHSFFSRHNPHPNRVKHIQGLNGRPVCMVRDDWFVTSSLFPHPLLKSHVLRKATHQSLAFPPPQNLYGVSSNTNKSAAQFSEAWRDELKDLAAKVSLSPSPQAQKDKKDDQPEEEFVRRKTQYSAETGRIIPPATHSQQRRPYSQRVTHLQTFHDQELMVFEILCQILQTDSLSTVQQWLLLAGQREKDLVMGMIKQAVDGADASGHQQQNFQLLQALHPGASPSVYGPPPWRKPPRTSVSKEMQPSSNDNPERIGDAEVLEVHSEAQEDLQDQNV